MVLYLLNNNERQQWVLLTFVVVFNPITEEDGDDGVSRFEPIHGPIASCQFEYEEAFKLVAERKEVRSATH